MNDPVLRDELGKYVSKRQDLSIKMACGDHGVTHETRRLFLGMLLDRTAPCILGPLYVYSFSALLQRQWLWGFRQLAFAIPFLFIAFSACFGGYAYGGLL